MKPYKTHNKVSILVSILVLLMLPLNTLAETSTDQNLFSKLNSKHLNNTVSSNLVGTSSTIGNMLTARYNHTATVLTSGKVLVVGGQGQRNTLASAELYDPTTDTWSNTGTLATAHWQHTATLLPNGKVLVVGGLDSIYVGRKSLSKAELYNPVTGVWEPTGSMTTPRSAHTEVLLPNGKVLVAGGLGEKDLLASAELYDPITGTWSNTGTMASTCWGCTMATLKNGKVLVTGGAKTSAELYDPISGTWSNTGSIAINRWFNTMTLLPDGKVLVAGGLSDLSKSLNSAELYDPATGTWSNTGRMSIERGLHTATLLPNGKVMVAGGGGENGAASSVEIYNPATGTWNTTTGLATARTSHTASLLTDGKVLFAGGNGQTGLLSSTELYLPTSAPAFNNPLFQTKWERADKPLADGVANPPRSWLWGPESFSPPTGTTEKYLDSPGGIRPVLYFDKARMELNNPATALVTNGLLVRELISGRLATGDTSFAQRQGATDIPIAGDPLANSGPTYASFSRVATTDNDNSSPDRTGQAVTDTITREGIVSNNPDFGGYTRYAYFDNTLKHNIPEVFWNFMNQGGNVYINGELLNNQPVLGDNPTAPWLDATGFPITEAYWSTVTVAGQPKLVLIQAFERRVLTYTPDNPAGFKVEMGNVGRHYFNWRYDPRYDLPTGADAQEKVIGKLTIWHAYDLGGSGEPAALNKALEAFKVDNPGAIVEVLNVPYDSIFRKFETEVTSGGGPDLFIAPNDNMGSQARAGLLAPLDDALKGKLENILPIALEGAKVNGKLYMVPESIKTVALFYNKDRITTPPRTTDEMLASQKSGAVKFGFNSSIYYIFGFTGAFGGKLLDREAKCIADQGGFSEAFKFMQDMKASGARLITDSYNASYAFQNGVVDAIIEGPWKTADFKKVYGEKLGIAPLPAGPKGLANPFVGVDGWYINGSLKGDKLTNAINFALYMTSPKIEQYFVDLGGHIPALNTIKVTDPITQGFTAAVATGYPRPLVPEMDNFWEPFGMAYTNATEYGAEAITSVKEACNRMNTLNGK